VTTCLASSSLEDSTVLQHICQYCWISLQIQPFNSTIFWGQLRYTLLARYPTWNSHMQEHVWILDSKVCALLREVLVQGKLLQNNHWCTQLSLPSSSCTDQVTILTDLVRTSDVTKVYSMLIYLTDVTVTAVSLSNTKISPSYAKLYYCKPQCLLFPV
jgi:hypothetical protein